MSAKRCQFCHKPIEVAATIETYAPHRCLLGSIEYTLPNGLTNARRFSAVFIKAMNGGYPCVNCGRIVERWAYHQTGGRPPKRKASMSSHMHNFVEDLQVAAGQWTVGIIEVWTGIEQLPKGGAGATPALALGSALQRYWFGSKRASFPLAQNPPTSKWLKAWATLLLLENYDDHCGVLMVEPELLADPESILACDITGRLMDGNRQ